MRPEQLLLRPPGRSRVDQTLSDEMGRLWAHLGRVAEQAGRPCRLVAFAGLSAGAGTTTLAIALARHLVHDLGEKVCLVEANLRRPALTRLLPRLAREPGLAEALAGRLPLEDTVRRIDDKGLSLLPAGQGHGAGTSLARDRLRRPALERLAEAHRTLILDGPPLGEGPEAQYLLREADLAVLVARARRTRPEALARALRGLHQDGVLLGGVALNRRLFALPGFLRRFL